MLFVSFGFDRWMTRTEFQFSRNLPKRMSKLTYSMWYVLSGASCLNVPAKEIQQQKQIQLRGAQDLGQLDTPTVGEKQVFISKFLSLCYARKPLKRKKFPLFLLAKICTVPNWTLKVWNVNLKTINRQQDWLIRSSISEWSSQNQYISHTLGSWKYEMWI